MFRSISAKTIEMYGFAYDHYLRDRLGILLVQNGKMKITLLNDEYSVSELSGKLAEIEEVPTDIDKTLREWSSGKKTPNPVMCRLIFKFVKKRSPNYQILSKVEFIANTKLRNEVLINYGIPYLRKVDGEGKLFTAIEFFNDFDSETFSLFNDTTLQEAERRKHLKWIATLVGFVSSLPSSYAQNTQLTWISKSLSKITFSDAEAAEELENLKQNVQDELANRQISFPRKILSVVYNKPIIAFLSFVVVGGIFFWITQFNKSDSRIILPIEMNDSNRSFDSNQFSFLPFLDPNYSPPCEDDSARAQMDSAQYWLCQAMTRWYADSITQTNTNRILELLQKSLDADEDYIPTCLAVYQVAVLYHLYEYADQFINDAIKRNPHFELFSASAHLNLLLGKNDVALTRLNQALEHLPDSLLGGVYEFYIRGSLAEVLRLKRDYVPAIENCSKALLCRQETSDSTFPRAVVYEKRAQCYNKLNELNKSLIDLTTALSLYRLHERGLNTTGGEMFNSIQDSTLRAHKKLDVYNGIVSGHMGIAAGFYSGKPKSKYPLNEVFHLKQVLAYLDTMDSMTETLPIELIKTRTAAEKRLKFLGTDKSSK